MRQPSAVIAACNRVHRALTLFQVCLQPLTIVPTLMCGLNPALNRHRLAMRLSETSCVVVAATLCMQNKWGRRCSCLSASL